MVKIKSESIRAKALNLFKQHGGMLRTSEAIIAGIHPRILYELHKSGLIIQICRGLYVLADLQDIHEPDLITITKKIPNGIICLISALYFHHLTVQIPKWIDVAVPQSYKPPILQNPPVHFHWFSKTVFNTGVETHNFNGIKVHIYSPEKTIVDCFRLRKKISIDIALEALKTYLIRKKPNLKLLRTLAHESRISQIIEPYIEALTHDQS
ncbi:MAG: type IV toxin-antitoxin system AbiEi family antitoxin domain-containing protein [Chlamydiota bacterium]